MIMFKDSVPKYWRLRDVVYRLKYIYCRDCGKSSFPPRSKCPYCGSSNIDHRYSKGNGVVEEYTVMYQSEARYQDYQPIVFGVIRLDEGFRIVAPIVDVDPNSVEEGMRVEATLRRVRVDGSTGLIQYGIKFRPSRR